MESIHLQKRKNKLCYLYYIFVHSYLLLTVSYNLEEIILPIILRVHYTNADVFISFFVYRIVAILLSATYVSLLLGLYVPSWEFEAPGNNSTLPIPFYVTTTKLLTLEFAV